jgi:hypothetical protein
LRERTKAFWCYKSHTQMCVIASRGRMEVKQSEDKIKSTSAWELFEVERT